MKYYQHRFDTVQQYLHHRDPYLLVEKIESIAPTKIVTSTEIRADTSFIQGHFPGSAILPGAMMQEMTTQSAGILIAANFNPMEEFNTEDPFFNEFALGVLVRIKHARYKSFARPGDTVCIHVSLAEQIGQMFEFEGRIHVGDNKIMQNRFQLTNIPSKTLQGTAI